LGADRLMMIGTRPVVGVTTTFAAKTAFAIGKGVIRIGSVQVPSKNGKSEAVNVHDGSGPTIAVVVNEA